MKGRAFRIHPFSHFPDRTSDLHYPASSRAQELSYRLCMQCFTDWGQQQWWGGTHTSSALDLSGCLLCCMQLNYGPSCVQHPTLVSSCSLVNWTQPPPHSHWHKLLHIFFKVVAWNLPKLQCNQLLVGWEEPYKSSVSLTKFITYNSSDVWHPHVSWIISS